MLVKLLVEIGDDEIKGRIGETVEVAECDGVFMIRAGYAEAAEVESNGQDDMINRIITDEHTGAV